MNIYFACSITGGRSYQVVYQSIVRALLADGHQIPTAHLAEPGVVDEERIIEPGAVYARDVEWIRTAQLLIAEVSVPSHGVGYEVAFALGLGKPVLCLHEQGRLVSKMITGNPDTNLVVASYAGEAEAVKIAQEFASRFTSRL